MRALVLCLILVAGCLDADPAPEAQVAPDPEPGMYRMGFDGLAPVQSFRGVSVEGDQDGASYTIDWLAAQDVDRLGFFLMDTVGTVIVESEMDLEVPVYDADVGEGTHYSAICGTQLSGARSEVFLDMLLGHTSPIQDAYPQVAYGGGGQGLGRDGVLEESFRLEEGDVAYVFGGVSGATPDDLADGDVLRTTVRIDGPHRFIGFEAVSAYCGNMYQFEQAGVVVPANIVQGSTLRIQGEHGLFACFQGQGGLAAVPAGGDGTLQLGNETLQLTPATDESRSSLGQGEAAITIESWRGYFTYALVAWPNVGWCY